MIIARLQDWWDDIWLVKVKVQRNTMGGNLVSNNKLVPRVRFHYGRDYQFWTTGGIGVYWSPRRVAWEGEVMYKHYARLTFPKLDWE